MSIALKVLFGSDEVKKYYRNIKLSEEEKNLHLKEYSFNTEAEKNAFLLGMDEVIGWLDYIPLDINEEV
jgi:hypothetical protein